MTTRQIQQLHYNGHRLFCPDHPERELEEAKASGGLPFSMLLYGSRSWKGGQYLYEICRVEEQRSYAGRVEAVTLRSNIRFLLALPYLYGKHV